MGLAFAFLESTTAWHGAVLQNVLRLVVVYAEAKVEVDLAGGHVHEIFLLVTVWSRYEGSHWCCSGYRWESLLRRGGQDWEGAVSISAVPRLCYDLAVVESCGDT